MTAPIRPGQVLKIPEAHYMYGACTVCRVVRCPDWLDAYDRLAAACKLMSEPGEWGGPLPPSQRFER
jgi:hypothetical protein